MMTGMAGVMNLQLLPLLRVQRELLDLPRGAERFRRYLEVMMDGSDEPVLPLAIFNPLSKPHVAERLDALLALGAEDIVADAIAQATARLEGIAGNLQVGLVLADDAQGGWTNRYLTDAQHRFANLNEFRRGFATALLWTAEEATPEDIRAEVLLTIYRACFQQRYGEPTVLRDMLRQEGLAAMFADMTPTLDPDEVVQASNTISAYLDTTQYPEVFACLYGDEAAVAVGYAALGLPAWAGFAVALAEAHERRRDPVAALFG